MEHRILYPLGSAQAEELALRAGLKAAIRQRLSPAAARGQRARLARAGLACATEAVADGVLVVAARDRALADAILALEATQRVGDDASRREAVREQGRLLGFPACCADAFAEGPMGLGAGSLPGCRAALAATAGALAPRLNVLDPGVFHYLAWLPCRFDCEPSRAYADRLAALIAARYPVFVRKVDHALAAHRLVVSERVQISLTGAWRDGALLVERAWATARDRRPGTAGAEADAAAAEPLVARIVGTPRVAVRGGILHVGEAPVAEAGAAVLLFPFGGRP